MTTDRLEERDGSQTNSGRKGILRNLGGDLLAVSRDVRILLLGQFFMNVSTFTAFPLMAVYMAQQLKFTAAEIGTVLTIRCRS
jgi:hypothetical protein